MINALPPSFALLPVPSPPRAWRNSSGGQATEGAIWYPALNPDGAEEVITYDLGVGDILPPGV